jgi:hypothetical protein
MRLGNITKRHGSKSIIHGNVHRFCVSGSIILQKTTPVIIIKAEIMKVTIKVKKGPVLFLPFCTDRHCTHRSVIEMYLPPQRAGTEKLINRTA